MFLIRPHQLVAKLKAIFDRFDAPEPRGLLNGVQVEQALVYMNRPVDSAAVGLRRDYVQSLTIANIRSMRGCYHLRTPGTQSASLSLWVNILPYLLEPIQVAFES